MLRRLVLALALILAMVPAALAGKYDLSKLDAVSTNVEKQLAALAHPLAFGNGPVEVILISDPFCRHCRRTYDFLQNSRDRVGTLRVVHVSLVGYAGSDMAGACADFLAEKGKGIEGLNLAYTLTPPTDEDEEQAARKVFQEFRDAFPEEFGTTDFQTFARMTMPEFYKHVQTVADWQFTGTPHVIINGRHLKGYNPAWLDAMLEPGD